MAASHDAESAGLAPRWLAIVASCLTSFFPGTGLLVFRRQRRDLLWPAAGLLLWSIAALGAGSRLSLVAMLVVVPTWLGGIVATCLASAANRNRGSRAWALALALVAGNFACGKSVKAFMLEAFQIPAGSMIPTLLIGDHIFVDKRATRPSRGDVIVFHYPLSPDTDYIKRVVGLPGETIAIRHDEIFIDDKPLPRRALDEACEFEGRPCRYSEEQADGHTYRVINDPDRISDLEPRTIPPDGYFVLGDNRDHSNDSRVWGTVPQRLVVGRAVDIWYSREPDGPVRWKRIGHRIE
jgi:signal peptidase I